MKITQGLLDGQVLQRDSNGRGSASVNGTCESEGMLEVRVLQSGKAVPGYNWLPAGRAEKKNFAVDIEGIRTGGPYRIEIRLKKGRKVVEGIGFDDIFVGDVWILAGQSNMEGVGNLVHAPKPHPRIRAFYMRDEWGIAKEPIHYLGEAVDVFHNEYGDGPNRPPAELLARRVANFVKGMSPGHAFAIEMLKRTKVPQGLIACAHGGTSMAQWSPELREQGGASLYGAMMRRYKKLGQPVAGLLWYQGESDANYEAAEIYTDKMVELIEATRRDMEIPDLPWFVVQLGSHASTEDDVSWNSVQEQQRRLPEKVKYLDIAPAIDLELDDGIHIGGRGQLVLGRRLARIADRMINKPSGVKAGIVLKKVEVIPTPGSRPEDESVSVKVTYGNVAGKLESDGRPNGFSLLDEKGRDVKGIFKTTVKGNSVTLHTNYASCGLGRLSLSYGHGRFPFCNITDSDGMSIPVMQALPIDPEYVRFCHNWQTALMPAVKSLSQASLAKVTAASGWKKAHLRNPFGVLPKPANSDKVGVYAMRTVVTASEDLEALFLLGANAPFKVWLNDKPLMSDPKADMPVQPGQYRKKISLKKGKNRVAVAFHIKNPGAHFGVCVRIGTLDEKRDKRIK